MKKLTITKLEPTQILGAKIDDDSCENPSWREPMRLHHQHYLILFFLLLLTAVFLAAEVPKSLKSRFVIGDPVWR